MEIPIFYTEAVKEGSGIDMLTRIHNFLPKSRQERLKVPICIRGTWDGVTIDELKPSENDHVVEIWPFKILNSESGFRAKVSTC
jgi:ureidoacrylate peracid hydrolase